MSVVFVVVDYCVYRFEKICSTLTKPTPPQSQLGMLVSATRNESKFNWINYFSQSVFVCDSIRFDLLMASTTLRGLIWSILVWRRHFIQIDVWIDKIWDDSFIRAENNYCAH